MDTLTLIVSIIILVMSVVIHELSHGYVAEMLGDPTPRLQGRLTLNPLKHLDLFGSFIIPIITYFAGFTFGWAKPVQWNPYNVKNKRWGELLISIAGPGSNILIAIVFGLLIYTSHTFFSSNFIVILIYIIRLNIYLALFNLIPLPPLDGSKVLFNILPARFNFIRDKLEDNSSVIFLLIIIFLYIFNR